MWTTVCVQDLNWDRLGSVSLHDDKIIIDGSGGEYGDIVLPIALMEQKIKEHNEAIQRSLLQSPDNSL